MNHNPIAVSKAGCCIFITSLFILFWLPGNAQSLSSPVKVSGAMRNVMWKGQLFATISTDTISNKQHLFGIGPLEYLSGEMLLLDGKTYTSAVLSDSTMLVKETASAKAPFLVYCKAEKWEEKLLPDSVQSLPQLESYLNSITEMSVRPFIFKLSGIAESADIHIVNLPKGSKVSSPADAHQGQKNYVLTNLPCDIIGFFSTEHKGIFTHHDTFLHAHLISSDRQIMGHLEKIILRKGKMRLFLAAD